MKKKPVNFNKDRPFPMRGMLIGEWGKSKMYRITCDCTDKDCDAVIDFEIDKDGIVWLAIHKDVEYCHYDHSAPASEKLLNILRRFKSALRLVFTGYLKMSSEMVFLEEKHINTFIEILQEGRDTLKEKAEKMKS